MFHPSVHCKTRHSRERHADSPSRWSAWIISLVMVVCSLFSLPQVGSGQATSFAPDQNADSSKTPKQESKPIARFSAGEYELKGGETHSYEITLSVGQFLDAVVEQKEIDVTVAIFGPDGEKISETDSPNDQWGAEPVLLIASKSGTYRVNVFSPNKRVPPGHYEIRIAPLKNSSVEDKARVDFQRVFDEGTKLSAERTADAKRSAIEAYKHALKFYLDTGDKYKESLTLRAIGVLHMQLNEFRIGLGYL